MVLVSTGHAGQHDDARDARRDAAAAALVSSHETPTTFVHRLEVPPTPFPLTEAAGLELQMLPEPEHHVSRDARGDAPAGLLVP